MTADMLLHWSPRSPFVRKVMIVAHECGLADRIETVRTVVAASTPNIELMKENPQSRLPTLRLADGTVIYDSPVICEYFDTLNNGREAVSGSVARAARRAAPPVARRRHARHAADVARRGDAPGRAAVDQAHAGVGLKTNVSVDALEEEADALAASRFSIGHIALGVALGYIDFRFPELKWRDGHPKLAAWHADVRGAAVRARPTEPVDEP